MTGKEYLQQIRHMDRRINLDIRRRDELKSMMGSLGSGGYEESHNPNKPQSAPFEDTVDKLIDLEKKINREIDALVDMKEEAVGLIRQLSNLDEQEVMELRYLHNMEWEDIAKDCYFSRRWVLKLHARGLEQFEMIFTRI